MDYSEYKYSLRERVRLAGEWIGISAVIAYFFYRSFIVFGILLFFTGFYFKVRKKDFIEDRRWKMTLEFKDAILCVSAGLRAGNVVENAFRKSWIELKTLLGEDSDVTEEFGNIARGLEHHMVLEEMLKDWAVRSGVEEIRDFAEIFGIAKRTGGNLREIISDSAGIISEKIEIRREIRVLLSSKQFEHRIMCLIPFFIMGYIGLTSKGYFDSLYHNLSGIGIMSACLLVYAVALFWGRRITSIEKMEG